MEFQRNIIAKTILRIVIGIIFIVSAVLKLISIDSFEIYIYSFGILKLNTAFLFARLIISFELLLGILLISGLYRKEVISVSMLMLLGFCFFLFFLIFSENTEHCHCFGDVFPISHTISVIKNIVLLVLLGLVWTNSGKYGIYHKYILLFLSVLCIAIPLIASPPDSLVIDRYKDKATFDKEILFDFLLENNYSDKSGIYCFLGANCRFCKLAAKKMSVISRKVGSEKLINYVFWGDSIAISEFNSETNSVDFEHVSVPGSRFLRITNGKMPLIIILEKGKVVEKYGYRDMDEKKIIDFLRNNSI